MRCTSDVIFCDICCFRSASLRMLSLKGIVNCEVFTIIWSVTNEPIIRHILELVQVNKKQRNDRRRALFLRLLS